MSENQLLDFELLNDYKSNLGIDVLQQMLDLYIGQSEKYLADIAQAATITDNALWHEKCHKMKGAASSSGMLEVRQYLLEIEHSSEAQEVKQNYAVKLGHINEQAVAAFKVWLNS